MHTFLIILACAAVGGGYAWGAIYMARVIKAKREQQKRYEKMYWHMRRVEIFEELHERAHRIIASGNDLDLGRSYDRLKAKMLGEILN